MGIKFYFFLKTFGFFGTILIVLKIFKFMNMFEFMKNLVCFKKFGEKAN